MLNLDFTDEQNMLREMVAGLCAQYATVEQVREMEDHPDGYSVEFWKQLGELGVLGMTIPEEFGGSGMTMIEGVVVYEEFGKSLAPTPHLASAVVSGAAISTGGSAEQKSAWLAGIASGDKIVVPAWSEPNNGQGPLGVQMRAGSTEDSTTVTGVKQHVYFASSADALLVLARTGDAPEAVDLFLVDPSGAGVELEQKMSISSDTQYTVTFDGAAAERVGAGGSGWATWERAMVDAMILAAAYANGGCEHALDITVEYSKDRYQFGKALAEFQALSHNMADAKTVLDGSKILNYEAAWAHSEGRDATKLAAMSKLFACNSYRDTTAMAQQIFGGVGFTLEYEIQLYFRRAKQLQITWNDTRRCEEIIAAAVLD